MIHSIYDINREEVVYLSQFTMMNDDLFLFDSTFLIEYDGNLYDINEFGHIVNI